MRAAGTVPSSPAPLSISARSSVSRSPSLPHERSSPVSLLLILAVQLATRVETCVMIHGVARPTVTTACVAHEMAEPTSCDRMSRTRS